MRYSKEKLKDFFRKVSIVSAPFVPAPFLVIFIDLSIEVFMALWIPFYAFFVSRASERLLEEKDPTMVLIGWVSGLIVIMTILGILLIL
ncbi:MAG: hypothetical protein ACTSR0_02315 [Candidatus Asgardarchaeia archaeon]